MARILRPPAVVAAAAAVFVTVLVLPSGLSATHRWGKYHWSRSANPLSLDVASNLDGNWASHLTQAIADWNSPVGGYTDVLNLTIIGGSADPATCPPTSGRVEVCNANHGDTGWLGIAQIWARGSHIIQATTQVNDYYFSNSYAGGFYNTSAWRQFVMCQEVGHDWGLDHQDENFYNTNLGSCMDYTDDPDGTAHDQLSNEHPNAHDFEELAIIYAHLDGSGGGGGGRRGGGGGGADLPAVALQHVPDLQTNWGQLVRSNGRVALYDRDLGNGDHIFTFVIWA